VDCYIVFGKSVAHSGQPPRPPGQPPGLRIPLCLLFSKAGDKRGFVSRNTVIRQLAKACLKVIAVDQGNAMTSWMHGRQSILPVAGLAGTLQDTESSFVPSPEPENSRGILRFIRISMRALSRAKKGSLQG
jgi:hypothetical protein